MAEKGSTEASVRGPMLGQCDLTWKSSDTGHTRQGKRQCRVHGEL